MDDESVSEEVEQRVASIIESCDAGRLGNYGGYLSDWTIRNGLVIWADVNHDGGPHLTVMEIDKFLEEYEEEEEEEDEG